MNNLDALQLLLLKLSVLLIAQATYIVVPTSTPVLTSVNIQTSTPVFYSGEQFTQDQIDQWTENTNNPILLRKIIFCESQNRNTEDLDSNKKMSRGILQFQDATWEAFAPLVGEATLTPLNPIAAINTADYMIQNGQVRRWTCFRMNERAWKPLLTPSP